MNAAAGPSRLRRLARPLVQAARYAGHRLRPRSSYASDREDVAADCLLGGVARFIDVGANDGFSCSNTFRFALQGAAGICFEPDPTNFHRLASLYRFNARVRRVPEGLSDTDGFLALRSDGLLSHFSQTDDPGLATLLEPHRRRDAPVVQVKVSRLASWFDRYPDFSDADLLSIDVEGHELPVLRGIDWARTPKPARCIVVETHSHGGATAWQHRDFAAIAALLAEREYREVGASANNTFWIHVTDFDPARLATARDHLPGYTWVTR